MFFLAGRLATLSIPSGCDGFMVVYRSCHMAFVRQSMLAVKYIKVNMNTRPVKIIMFIEGYSHLGL